MTWIREGSGRPRQKRLISVGGPSRAAARVGGVLCAVAAVYFLVIAGYGLIYADDYAGDMPRILRYVAGPIVIACLLLTTGRFAHPEIRLMTGLTSAALLFALFAFE